MKEVLTRWYQRYLSEEEAVILLVMLTVAFVVMLAFGDILAPVFVAVILAYLMQGVANLLRQRACPRNSAWPCPRYCSWGASLPCCSVWRHWCGGSWWRLVREAPTMIEAGRKV